MKATLEFDLNDPDQRVEHLRCVKSLDMAIVISKTLQAFRSAEKLGVIDTGEHIRAAVYNALEDNNVDIDELIS